MEAAVGFLGLDAATATETDVHAALDGATPLAKQLEAARMEAVADMQKHLDEFKATSTASDEKMKDFQKQLDALKADVATKDERIAELQKEIATGKQATENLKAQHKTETEKLAGELAKNKAGGALELEVAGDVHDAGKPDKSKSGAQVVVATSASLKALTQKKTA